MIQVKAEWNDGNITLYYTPSPEEWRLNGVSFGWVIDTLETAASEVFPDGKLPGKVPEDGMPEISRRVAAEVDRLIRRGAIVEEGAVG